MSGNKQPSISSSEHVGPDTTGDNIHAKRNAMYRWDSATSTWVRFDGSITTGDIEIGAVEIKDGTTDTRATLRVDGLVKNYDTKTFTQGTTTTTIVYSLVGVTVATKTINFTDATKSAVSTIVWS